MKKAIFTIMMCLCIGVLCSDVSADTITLTGQVRDFTSQHPDFEKWLCGYQTGLVSNDLGTDRKPVFGPNGLQCISSPESFGQWFNDVPGVNQSLFITLTLDNGQTEKGGVYTYENPNFFPIDDNLFGNEGLSHNYHFTFELHSAFTYKGGETFSFYGDDDVWVFINKKLVVDLGGVHNPISGSVNLDSLGLTVGQTYDFDMFFVERHTINSCFKIQTTIVLDDVITCNDSDGDGVIDQWDKCSGTPAGSWVDKTGCPASGLYTEAQMNQMVQAILTWGDMNGDKKIDLSEAIHALRVTSGITQPAIK